MFEITRLNYISEEDIVLDSSSAIIQGNYSMVLCGGEPSTCPKSIRSPSGEIQRVSSGFPKSQWQYVLYL